MAEGGPFRGFPRIRRATVRLINVFNAFVYFLKLYSIPANIQHLLAVFQITLTEKYMVIQTIYHKHTVCYLYTHKSVCNNMYIILTIYFNKISII